VRPLVSVIVAAQDEARFIGEALESVWAQPYRPIEVIVADDGSTDDTAGIAERAGVRVLGGPFGGPGAARNVALAAAQGEYWTPFDADDLMPPEGLGARVSALEADPDLGFVFGRTEFFLTPGEPRPDHFRPEWTAGQSTGLPNGMVARRSLLATVGGYDEEYRVGEDTDWFMRAVDAGVRWQQLDVVSLHYRIHAGNISRDVATNQRTMLALLRASVQRRREAARDR
jgi:glycosyltransferase involved in cell wall biosynthesis